MTLTISVPDLATIRRRTGDKTAPQDLTDAEIDAIYTDVDLGNSDLDRTTFYVVRERLGVAVNSTAISNPTGGITRNQKFEQLERLLKYWGGVAGLGGEDLSVGVLSLGIDSTCDDLTTLSEW